MLGLLSFSCIFHISPPAVGKKSLLSRRIWIIFKNLRKKHLLINFQHFELSVRLFAMLWIPSTADVWCDISRTLSCLSRSIIDFKTTDPGLFLLSLYHFFLFFSSMIIALFLTDDSLSHAFEPKSESKFFFHQHFFVLISQLLTWKKYLTSP